MFELVVGPMFAGKSSHLANRYRGLQVACENVVVFTSPLDVRPAKRHDGGSYPPAEPLLSHHQLRRAQLHGADVVLVDEAQFLEVGFVDCLEALTRAGISVTAYGLDLDADRAPWAFTARLAERADRVTQLTATCSCGKPAPYTKRIRPRPQDATRVQVGGYETYQPACDACWSLDG